MDKCLVCDKLKKTDYNTCKYCGKRVCEWEIIKGLTIKIEGREVHKNCIVYKE